TRKPMSAFWMNHSEGRQFTKLQTVPPGSEQPLEPGAFNLWHGFAVEAKTGDWSKNKAHIKDIICAGDEAVFQWVMNWMASLVQRPGVRPRSASLMQGGQGTGKGWFAHNILGSLFYPGHYIHLVGGSQLTGRFNDHLSGKVLVFADEAVWSHGAGEVLE